MTKARGAADSIGKAGRGASFLLPAFSPYYVPYFPLFLRARACSRSHQHASTDPHIRGQIRTHIPAFSFLSVLPLVSVDLLSYPPSPSTPFSFCRSPHRSAAAFVLLFVAIVRTCVHRVRVCTCALSQSSYARFHVARLCAPAASERAALYVGERENVF